MEGLTSPEYLSPIEKYYPQTLKAEAKINPSGGSVLPFRCDTLYQRLTMGKFPLVFL